MGPVVGRAILVAGGPLTQGRVRKGGIPDSVGVRLRWKGDRSGTGPGGTVAGHNQAIFSERFKTTFSW